MGVADEIKERLDIVEFISHYVPLKKAGHNYKGLCPFHTEKTPSFIVFPDTQSWHCFGACATGGDIFSFVMRRENMDFPEALRYLAERAGISLRPQTKADALASQNKALLIEIAETAAGYYHHLLLESDAGKHAKRYLERRGIQDATIAAFQLGYALDDWHALERYLVSRKYRVPDILAAGLLIEREDGAHHDRFRGRLMFPIRDMRGRVVGFGGRVLDDGLPKYLNSPQTTLFDKSSILYGIDLARETIRREGLAIIVEGYMDVLMAHQHGMANVIASMGTALTEKQLRVLKRLTKKLALALDSDAAGDQGTLRGLGTAQGVMDRRVVPVPTWKGLINYEARLDAEIRIITLPPDRDPDEIIRDDPAEWQRLVDASLSVVDYYFRALTRDLDLQSSKGKAEAAKRLLPVVAEVASRVERAHYLQRLARLVKMDERALAREIEKRPRSRVLQAHRKVGRFSGFPGLPIGVERYCLLLLMQDLSLLQTMNDTLADLQLDPLGVEDLEQPAHREIFAALQTRWQREEPFTREDLDTSDATMGEVYREFQAFLEDTSSLPETDPTLAASRCALQLRKLHVGRQLVELRYLLEDAQDGKDGEAMKRWAELVVRCNQEERLLDEALSRVTVLGYREKEGPPTF